MKNEVGGSDETIEKAVGGNLWALLWQHTHPAPADGQPDVTPFGNGAFGGNGFHSDGGGVALGFEFGHAHCFSFGNNGTF